MRKRQKIRRLALVLGDQLDHDSPVFNGWDAKRDYVWMAEVSDESTHVWTAKPRIAVFLAAMRHHRQWLEGEGRRVHYICMDDATNQGSLAKQLAHDLKRLNPEEVVVVQPGEYRVQEALKSAVSKSGYALTILEDTHFLASQEDFKRHAEGRKQVRMEYFYREMRKRYGYLMDDAEPAGGKWNYDHDNRGSFGKTGPEALPEPFSAQADQLTREVIDLVETHFADHPGSLDRFCWPVTRKQALEALERFIRERLPSFGLYQDAMWQDEPFLYHALLASSLNLKLLNPREVITAAEDAWREGHAPLEAVEGFIRQILGWREYVRGIYWMHMPEYLERNALGAQESLPDFFWTGETPYNCLSQAIGQTLSTGYAHHIQRLMVTGLYAMLLGVRPQEVHAWYLAVYVDAVEWVELPNVLGMSQYGDGGLMASKPYAATGKYIQRMSNYCQHCPCDPKEATGDKACPFTTLYWDFLLRHEKKLLANPRMSLQVKNLKRLANPRKREIQALAQDIRKDPAGRSRAQSYQGELALK
ncbi:MAG: cryptochrome/photolyase family protein [Verrucomicrobiota bacterium]